MINIIIVVNGTKLIEHKMERSSDRPHVTKKWGGMVSKRKEWEDSMNMLRPLEKALESNDGRPSQPQIGKGGHGFPCINPKLKTASSVPGIERPHRMASSFLAADYEHVPCCSKMPAEFIDRPTHHLGARTSSC
jgi:hypothetical protein